MNVFKIFSKSGTNNSALGMKEEAELMLKIKNAQSMSQVEREFGALYDSLSSKLWGKLYKKFSAIIELEDLEDAFQEGWRKVLENRKSYLENSNVYNWIYTILKNTAFDFTRKDKKTLNEFEFFNKSHVKSNTDGGEDENIFDFLPGDGKTVEDEIDAREIIKIVLDAIENIEDETDRTLIKKRIVDGIKYSDIAEDMDMPVATVHYRINQEMNRLRARLKKELEL